MKPHFAGDVGEDTMTVPQLDSKHRVRKELDDSAFYFNCVFPRHVRISGSAFVIKTVCSKWADGIPSAVHAVQPSSSNLTAPVPKLTIGSMATASPPLSRGPLPRIP